MAPVMKGYPLIKLVPGLARIIVGQVRGIRGVRDTTTLLRSEL